MLSIEEELGFISTLPSNRKSPLEELIEERRLDKPAVHKIRCIPGATSLGDMDDGPLVWRKNNKDRFSHVGAIKKDSLAIPNSWRKSGRGLSCASNIISDHRSELGDNIISACMCSCS